MLSVTPAAVGHVPDVRQRADPAIAACCADVTDESLVARLFVNAGVRAGEPQDDFEYAEWHLARVGIDYHVEVQSFFYSVPHVLIREQVDTRATVRTIELFHRGKRVAAHARRYGGPRHGTQPEHMPSAHRRYADWSAERFARQARDIGPETEGLILAVLARRPHPEQGFRTCMGRRGAGGGDQPPRRRSRRADLRQCRLDP